jgi:hypothetical protein
MVKELSHARSAAEALAGSWIAAAGAGDVTTLVSLSEAPFSLDKREILAGRQEMETRFRQVFGRNRDVVRDIKIGSIRARTLNELKVDGTDLLGRHDPSITGIHLDESDWMIETELSKSGRPADSAMFFARQVGGALKIVAFWD